MSERVGEVFAFPQQRDADGTWPYQFELGGMTLRDYFAAHAPDVPMAVRTGSEIVEWRWAYADMMLAARK